MQTEPAEKSEEQIARERDAVEAMRNAKANMASALDRIQTLETALKLAIGNLDATKRYIGPSAYTWPHNGKSETAHTLIDRQIAEARAKLGVAA